ncbi:MAG TPA: hypothetical protein VEW26_02755 [Allosphingosinicella sp.]|nr:hypothetical protein [Allosphingosinicella sp.]
MTLRTRALALALLLAPPPLAAQSVEKVRGGSPDAEKLPEDLFALPPGAWAFARHHWEGESPCAADGCEAGYTSGDLVVSVERDKENVRILAGFRGCPSVAWNYYEIGGKASGRDSKTIGKRIRKAVATSAKYCKVAAPAVAELDARRLYPALPPAAP